MSFNLLIREWCKKVERQGIRKLREVNLRAKI